MQWFTRGRVRPVHDVPLLQDQRGSSSGGPSPTSSMEIKVPTPPSADASLSGRRQQLDIHTKCPAWAAYDNGRVLTVGGCLGAIVPGLQDTVQACCISTNETLLAVGGLRVTVCQGHVCQPACGMRHATRPSGFCHTKHRGPFSFPVLISSHLYKRPIVTGSLTLVACRKPMLPSSNRGNVHARLTAWKLLHPISCADTTIPPLSLLLLA
jgi:hypothetical protein